MVTEETLFVDSNLFEKAFTLVFNAFTNDTNRSGFSVKKKA